MTLQFKPISTDLARAIRAGAPDAYGNPAERQISASDGNPCRHCLRPVPPGSEMLVFALRPFSSAQPYAETGPAFLCADDCTAFAPGDQTPEIFRGKTMLIRGYDADERIVYGTGQVVPPDQFRQACADLLARPEVAQVHICSATNNCYQASVAAG